MQPAQTQLSIIVPHLNQPEALDACLGSLDAQTIERSLYEIVVVDNGSARLPISVVKRHRGVRLLREPMPGPGLARNRGVRSSAGDIVCFIDADCRAHPDWLKTVTRIFPALGPGIILGGDVRIWRSDESAFTALEAYESVFAYRFKLYIEQHGYSGTGNLAMRRSDFAKVGPFAGIHVAEDVEWGSRARAAGLTFRYVPDMVVYHPARRSLRELFEKWDRHIQHSLHAESGKLWWRVRWIGRTIAVLLSPSVDVGRIWTSQRLRGTRARGKASMVLAAVRAYRAWRMLTALLSNKGVVWNRAVEVDPTCTSNDGKPHDMRTATPP